MLRFLKLHWYRFRRDQIEDLIQRGHNIVAEDKEILRRDAKRLSDAYKHLRSIRSRLDAIEPAHDLIDAAMRRTT